MPNGVRRLCRKTRQEAKRGDSEAEVEPTRKDTDHETEPRNPPERRSGTEGRRASTDVRARERRQAGWKQQARQNDPSQPERTLAYETEYR